MIDRHRMNLRKAIASGLAETDEITRFRTQHMGTGRNAFEVEKMRPVLETYVIDQAGRNGEILKGASVSHASIVPRAGAARRPEPAPARPTNGAAVMKARKLIKGDAFQIYDVPRPTPTPNTRRPAQAQRNPVIDPSFYDVLDHTEEQNVDGRVAGVGNARVDQLIQDWLDSCVAVGPFDAWPLPQGELGAGRRYDPTAISGDAARATRRSSAPTSAPDARSRKCTRTR